MMRGKPFLKATPDQLTAMLHFMNIRVYDDSTIQVLLHWAQGVDDMQDVSAASVVSAMQSMGTPRK